MKLGSVTMRAGFAALVVAACGSAASAQALHRVILSNIQTDPTGLAPGLGGLTFNAGTNTQFDRPFMSPDGKRWIIGGVLETPAVTTNDETIYVGMGLGPPTLIAREGNSATAVTGGAADTYGIFKEGKDINNAGQFVFVCDTGPATTLDDYLVKFDGTSLGFVIKEGTPAPAPFTGNYNSPDSVCIDQTGRVGWVTTAISGTTPVKQVAFFDATVVAETDVGTGPTGQLVAPDQSIDTFNAAQGLRINRDGSSRLTRGDLNGPTATDLFLAVDGALKIQEGALLPGGSPAANVIAIDEARMGPNGDWIARGTTTPAGSPDYVVLNGTLAAKTTDPITPGNTELFSDAPFSATFFSVTVNCRGDYIIGGTTTNADVLLDAVLVLNGKRVVARQGDNVDLNGNGLPDDGWYLQTFNNDDLQLTPDGWVYMTIDIKNDPLLNTAANQAFVRFRAFCPGDHNRDGMTSVQDIFDFLADWFANSRRADQNCAGGVSTQDIFDFLADWFAACP